MFLAAEMFALPARLCAAFPAIRREVDALPATAWHRWPGDGGVYGEVRLAPLHLTYRPALLPPPVEVEEPVRAVCATTWATFGPGAVTLVLSRMGPGCRIGGHRDLDGPGFLRCHLAVCAAPGARLRVDREVREWREGECLVFDPRRVHEVSNDSGAGRTILIVDFVPSPAELAAMAARGQALTADGSPPPDSLA